MIDLVSKGSRDITGLDVTRYEGTNTMEPNVRAAVEGHLRHGA
jgi:hypothetical protein